MPPIMQKRPMMRDPGMQPRPMIGGSMGRVKAPIQQPGQPINARPLPAPPMIGGSMGVQPYDSQNGDISSIPKPPMPMPEQETGLIATLKRLLGGR